MKKLPKNLYHFTSPIHMEFIREDGFLKLTDSNLKIDRARGLVLQKEYRWVSYEV